MIWRIRPISFGSLLAFLRAFSARFAALACALASLAAAFGSLPPPVAFLAAALAITTHFRALDSAFLHRRSINRQCVAGLQCLAVQPTGTIGGAYEWSTHYASETGRPSLVCQFDELLWLDPAVHRMMPR